jgi:outer membrane protein TolC
MNLANRAVAVVVAAVLSACASTHGLAPQSSMNKPDALQASSTLASSAVSPDAWPDTKWWTRFADPQSLIPPPYGGSWDTLSELQLDVAQATLKQRETIYKLTQDRNEAGIDSRLELRQAESALPAAREQIAQLQELIDLTRNQLAALLGEGPDRGLAIQRPLASALTPVALPSKLPSELLGHRPVDGVSKHVTGKLASLQ